MISADCIAIGLVVRLILGGSVRTRIRFRLFTLSSPTLDIYVELV